MLEDGQIRRNFEVTAKKLFGMKYERLIRALFLELVVFWGLRIAGSQVEIALSILYLMAGALSNKAPSCPGRITGKPRQIAHCLQGALLRKGKLRSYYPAD